MPCLHEVQRLKDPEFKWLKKRGKGGKNKDVQFYSSFTYDEVEYGLNDCVYMYKEGEEPYIGKIVKMWETADKSKKVKVHWFFRPSEIAYYLKDEDVLENELFFASGEGLGLENPNPLEAIAGKCNVVCISEDARNPQPSEEELQMADYVFYRTFDVKSCTIFDQMGDRVGGIEVQYVFNQRKSTTSVGVPDRDLNIQGVVQSSIAYKGTTEVSGKHSPHESNNLKPDEHAKEATNTKQEPVELESFRKVDVERVRPIRKSGSGDVDDAPSKRMKFNGAVSSPKADGTNHVHGNVMAGVSSLTTKLMFNLDGSGKDMLSENANLLEEKLSTEKQKSGDLEDDIGVENEGESTKNLNDVAVQAKVSGTKKHKNLGEISGVYGQMPLVADDVSSRESMRSRIGVSSNEMPRVGFNIEVEGSEQAKQPVKISSATKVGLLKTNNITSKEKLKLGRDSCHSIEDKSLAKDSRLMGGVTSTNSVDNITTWLRAKTRASEPKKVVSCVTPYDNNKKLKVSTEASKECDNEKVGKFSCDKLLMTPLGGGTGKVGYATFEVTRRPIVEKNWIKLPWEQRMKDAHDQGKLVLLQNLDPEYTSGDVQDIIWTAFGEQCTAKVVQQTATSNPYSGQAFVTFRSREAADEVVRKLNDGCLMLANRRPLVASTGYFPKLFEKQMTFVGHLVIDKAKRQIQRDTRDAVSTSHYSQNNTIEYEMALAWCLLQSKSDKWWEKLYEQQRKEMRKLTDELKSKAKADDVKSKGKVKAK